MKRRQFLKMAPLGILAGCAVGQNLKPVGEGFSSDLANFTVESLAVLIGYYAAKNDLVDTALRNVYSLAKDGTLTPEGINIIFKSLDTKDPIQVLMVKRVIRLIGMVGGSVYGTQVLNISGLDPALVEAAASGYVEGYNSYQDTHGESA